MTHQKIRGLTHGQVVAISLFSMVITQQAAASANGQAPNGAPGGALGVPGVAGDPLLGTNPMKIP